MTNYKGETSLETRKQAEELLAELRRQAYAEGYEQGKYDAQMDELSGNETAQEYFERTFEQADFGEVSSIEDGNIPRKTAREFLEESRKETLQEKRDRIVEQAKADVLELQPTKYGNLPQYEFVVNKEKRTVVALVRGMMSGKVVEKGIAKCAPDDCFNAHIGRAIAIRRALGLEVPNEYIYAPQPTEVRVADIIEWGYTKRRYRVIGIRRGVLYNFINIVSGERFYDLEYRNLNNITKIVDDSESIAP